ncbi:MAG TPA: MFS transporter [Steroidobacteraceae bacterium]|nr:MFS transporter [Steroidobacteraceae bacterium]
MAQRTAKAAGTPAATAAAAPPAWGALRYPTFRSLWVATLVSNVGGWMYSAASGWLMTTLNPSPLMVSLVQVATSLPLFLFALPAGALADMLDKRRLILVLEILTTLFSAVFALLLTLHAVGPALLLLFTFLVGTLGALETPAWQAIVSQLVPAPALSSAIAINSLGVNISRVIGPAITGVIIAGLGIAAPFWLDAFSNAGVIGVIYRWRPPPRATLRTLPAESLTGATRAGLRYARYNGPLRATLARAVGFFLFASAYWALLPLVARSQLQGGPALYGTLLAAIGAGAVGGALFLPRMQARLGADGVVVLGEAGTAAALVLFGLAHQPWVAVLACLLAGVSWIAVLAVLNVSAQTVLPDWVRGRGLAVYVTVFFGALTIGSALWGFAAERLGLPAAHFLAGGGAFIALWVTRRWPLQSGPAADLTPSMHWPEPVLAAGVDQDAGPVLVTIEYHVAAENREAFLAALVPLCRERRRDGAYDWNVFEDTTHPERMIETFLTDSWLDHLRQHQRVTRADRAAEERVQRLAREPPRVTHYIAARPRGSAD